MKTYEEMARSVMEKAQRHRRKQKRTMISVISSVAVFAVCLTAAFAVWGEDSGIWNMSGEDTWQPRLVLRCSATEFRNQEGLLEDVVSPLEFMLRVRDIRGMTPEQVNLVLEEEENYKDQWWQGEDGLQGERSYTRWGTDNAYISLFYNEFLYLAVSDFEQVKDFTVKTTETGSATVVPYPYIDSQDEGVTDAVKTGIHINWSLSDYTIDEIEKNPEIKLSEIKDTVSVSVEFEDGTTETAVIDITVDDEGQVYVTNKGIFVN